ncbi:MAG: large subunit ribosomal protein [Thermoplasmata archaeon]|jgi:large subunit ribosomal protein L22|nr:large subunit ribosomal protein [Thermoplasmata archaeon]
MATYYSTVPADPAQTARAYGRDLDCSPKSGRNVARAIKGMPVGRAKEFLASVTRLETPVPFKVRNRKIHHRRGEGFGPGKWPVGVTKRFLKVLESAEANAEYKGLDKERLVITHATAYQGTVIQAYTPRAMGRATPHYNRMCNFEVIVTQLEETTEDAAAKATTPKGSRPAKKAAAKKTAKKKEA